MTPSAITPIACVIVIAIACWFDLRTRRVPNVLTLGAALVGIAFRIATDGGAGAMSSVMGLGVGVCLFFPLFALGGMGAGDVKLLGAIGVWLGPAGAMWAAAYSALAGGVLALGVALVKGYLRTALFNIWGVLGYWRLAGLRPADGMTLDTSSGPRLPYALPIAVGTLLTLWLQ